MDAVNDPVVDVDGLDERWLTEVLGTEVTEVVCARVGTGMTAAAYRLSLISSSEPTTIIAKVAHGDEAARRRVAAGFRAEVGFYAHVVETLDVRAPRCHYAAISDDALRFTILLEDLSPRVPGVQADGCSLAQARQAVRNLAGLHAPRWGDRSLLDFKFAPKSTSERSAFLASLAEPATAVFVDRYGPHLSEREIDILTRSAEALEVWFGLRAEPFTVVHGDYRLDNLMFAPDGSDVVAVDWQTLTIAPGARDLAYFLGTCLPVDDRRSVERELVSLYQAEMARRGVCDYSFERCFDDYRLGQLQAPMITTMGAAFATATRSRESDEMFLAMAHRSCAAIRDLGSLEMM
jgi:aminoglycoside/choline kinase family phosphotransferase